MVIKPNSTTSSSQVNLTDRDIIVLILDFLDSKNLNISQIALEQETGIVNGTFSDEVLFLRNLIVEGAWDAAVDYVEPLQQAPNFDYNLLKRIVYRYKYLELLCIKNEVGNSKFSESAAIACLRDLEKVCDKNEFNGYRLLLSYPNIQEHPDYHDWNPSGARVKCFREVRPIVESVLQVESLQSGENCASPPNRLVHLLIKGILYETAGRLCAQRAKKGTDDLRFPSLLPRSSATPDMTLLSWLQSIPAETFGQQFEEKNMPLNYQKFEKPLLEASWTEVIQATPIRSRGQQEGLPLSSTARVPVNDRMVQSMVEQMDGFRKKTHGSVSARQRVLSQSFHLGGLGQEDPFINGIFSGTPRQSPQLSSRSSSARAELGSGDAAMTNGASPSVFPDQREKYAEPLSPITEQPPDFESVADTSDVQSSGSASTRNGIEAERLRLQCEWDERQRSREALMAQILGPVSSAGSTPKTPSFNAKNSITSPLVYKNVSATSGSSDSPTVSKLDFSAEAVSGVESEDSRPLIKEESSLLTEVDTAPKSEYVTALSRAESSRVGSSPESFLSSKPSIDLDNISGRASTIQDATLVRFVPVQVTEEVQFIRCAAFHPSGAFYAVGSNAKTLRICAYPEDLNPRSLRPEQTPLQAPVVDTRLNYHKGSIFCLAWDAKGTLIASGSNDRTLRLCGFDPDKRALLGNNIELRFHDDTIRDVAFMDDSRSSSSALVVSAGADSKICLTDGATATRLQRFSDHTASVLSVHSWSSGFFVSGSQDKSCRLWDLRSLSSTKLFNQKSGLPDSPVTCVRVDCSGRILVTAHETGECSLWDLRSNKILQTIRAHEKDTRGLSISPSSSLLLSASYDKTVVAHNLEGNLFEPLPSVIAAAHPDKVLQCHLHPRDKSFLTTSADKTCVLWGYPEVPE